MYTQYLLAVLFIVICYYYWKKYSPYFSFPCCTLFDWKLLLMILQRKRRRMKPITMYLLENLEKKCQTYKHEGMFVIWAPKPMLYIYSPESIKFFSKLPDKPSFIYKFFNVFLRNGMFTSNGEKMKKRRKLVSSSFYPGMMKHFVPTMNDHAACLVEELKQLENNTTSSLGKIMESRTLKLFFDAALGMKEDSTKSDNRIEAFIKLIMSAMDFVSYRILKPWLHMDFMLRFFSAGRKHIKEVNELHCLAKQTVEEMKKSYCLRRVSMVSDNTNADLCEQRYKSVGDVLIEEHLRDPAFTLEDVQMDLILLILASFDTASHTLTWTLWLLGLHEEIQAKAYDQIISVASEVLQYEDIRQLTYLENIIKESLRLYPVIPAFARQPDKDLHFEKHMIPKGTNVVFFPYLLHRNPEVYPEPESFHPERFEDASYTQPWTLIPFAEGTRSCIGKNFAMFQLKIILAHVIRNFKIVSLTHREDMKVTWKITLKSVKPLSVKFIPR